jgi:hypothetical protein
VNRRTLARSLRALTVDPVGRYLLADADAERLAALTSQLVADDPFGERPHLDAALARVGRPGEAHEAIGHQVWCAHREAAWRTGRLDPASIASSLLIEGEQWAIETDGYATVLVSPMTIALSDASWVIAHALRRLAPGRRLRVYGDGIEPCDIGIPEIDARVAGGGLVALRDILDVLTAGGVFCTYADFVYQGHEAVQIDLFGGPHAISSAFVGLAARPNTMLLPCLLTRGPGDRIRCRFSEPTMVAGEAGPQSTGQRIWQHRSVAQLVATMLEALIAEAPLQWQLLATLSYAAPQMERA